MIWVHAANSGYFISLKALSKSINNNLQVFYGDTLEVLKQLMGSRSNSRNTWNKMYDEASIKIENNVIKIANNHKVKQYIYNSSLLKNPSETLKKTGHLTEYLRHFINRII